jgi:hypothetical protein
LVLNFPGIELEFMSRAWVWALIFSLLGGGLFSPNLLAQSRSIYGIHDFEPRPDGFLAVIEEGGARGMVTATEAVGHDPVGPRGFQALTTIFQVQQGRFAGQTTWR